MMLVVKHRVNSVASLLELPKQFGAEIDVRWDSGGLWLGHDPGQLEVQFVEWIEVFRHRTLILNVKEEGLEPFLIKILEEKGIRDYFFLDQSLPYQVRYSDVCGRRSAIRVSEYESVDEALSRFSIGSWIWLDSFSGLWFTANDVERLKLGGFRICLVSPELQSRISESEMFDLKAISEKVGFDAVCTKRLDFWCD